MASMEDLFAYWWIWIVSVPLLALIIKALFDKYKSRGKGSGTSFVNPSGKDEKFRCPRCGIGTKEGFVLCGRGIIWADKSGKPISLFTTIFRALENTISWRLRPAVNIAWHCSSCKIVIVDHSRLVTQK